MHGPLALMRGWSGRPPDGGSVRTQESVRVEDNTSAADSRECAKIVVLS